MKKILLINTLMMIFISCSSIQNENSNIKKGYFSYFADAALFVECISNNKYPVAMENDYIALERAYLELDKNPGEKILVEIIGEIERRDKIEGEGKNDFLIVKKFVKILPNEQCK